MSTALENAYQNALACRPSDSKRIERAYHLALDPRTKVLDSAVDVPSESCGFIVITWAHEGETYRIGKCECADHVHGIVWCKHRLCVALILRASDVDNPLPPLATLWECEGDEEAAPLNDSETKLLVKRLAMYGEA